MNANKIILGVLGGLVTGAALGILFAPDSGKKTRKKIKDKSQELKDSVKEEFDKLVKKADNKYQTISEDANEFLLHQAKPKIENEIAKNN